MNEGGVPDEVRHTFITAGDEPQAFDSIDALDARRLAADIADAEQDTALKKRVTRVALGAMVGQLLITDVIFVLYGCANDWHVHGALMGTFLTENFAQTVGIVYVISNYLFPSPRRSGRSG